MLQTSNPGHALRRSNRATVMNLLYRKGGMQRADLCEETGLTAAAVSRITRQLIDAGLVQESDPVEKKGTLGRRRSFLSVNPEGAFVVAMTITANRKSTALFNAAGEEISQQELGSEEARSPENIIEQLCNLTKGLIADHGIDSERVAGIGIGMAMQASEQSASDERINSKVLGWKNIPLASLVKGHLPYPVAIEPRALALLRAEVGKLEPGHTDDLYLINIGLGSGTAGYFNGEVLSGGRGEFGSINHIPHPQSQTECECGRRGCLEHSANGAAVVMDCMRQRAGELTTFGELGPLLAEAVERASEGNLTAREAFFEAGRKMATGVDTVLAMLNPDQIIMAGETGRQKDYIEGLHRGLSELRSPLGEGQLKISDATSAEASAAIALDALVYSEHLNVESLNVA